MDFTTIIWAVVVLGALAIVFGLIGLLGGAIGRLLAGRRGSM